jgi:hypothetical protein
MGEVEARDCAEVAMIFLKGGIFGACRIIEPALMEYRPNLLQNQ